MTQSVFKICQGNRHIFLRIQCRTNRSKKMRILRNDRMLIIQFQSPDKRRLELGKEMQRTAKECYMTTDRFTAGKTGNRLVYNCLENRCRQVFLRCALVDQRLDIRLCKYTAAGSDRIKCFVIFCIFIQTGSICLKQGCHLVDKGTCTSGTDTVHSLFNVSTLKIDDLGILTAKLNRNICLRCDLLQRSRNRDNLLHERDFQMVRKCQTTRTCDHRAECHLSKFCMGFLQQISQCFLDVCKMTFVICKQKLIVFIKNRNLYCSRSDINSQCVCIQ